MGVACEPSCAEGWGGVESEWDRARGGVSCTIVSAARLCRDPPWGFT